MIDLLELATVGTAAVLAVLCFITNRPGRLSRRHPLRRMLSHRRVAKMRAGTGVHRPATVPVAGPNRDGLWAGILITRPTGQPVSGRHR